MARLVSSLKKSVASTVESAHSKRVALVHKVRGTREDGLLGKTELEARMYEASQEEKFGKAAVLKERLDAILEATSMQQQAAAAKDYDLAEEWNHKLNVLREREPFEKLLAERAAERVARGDRKQKKAGLTKRVSMRVAESAHNVRVITAYKVRGTRKDGGLGKTELEAMAIQAESRGQLGQAAFLLLRARALSELGDAKHEAEKAGDAAEVARTNAELVRLRDRAPFMAELATLHKAPPPKSPRQASASSSETEDEMLFSDVHPFLRSNVFDSAPQTAVAMDAPLAPSTAVKSGGGSAASTGAFSSATSGGAPATAAAAAAAAAPAAGTASPSSVAPPGDLGGASSYETFMDMDVSWYKERGVSGSDGNTTFGGMHAPRADLADGCTSVGGAPAAGSPTFQK